MKFARKRSLKRDASKTIRKGDEVVVIAGKDKGRKGTVTQVQDGLVTVEGVNIVKKHRKATREVPGAIVEKEKPLPLSNVSIVDGDGNPSRVGFKILSDGKKVRVFKTTGQEIDL